jgi:hypothetical protein
MLAKRPVGCLFIISREHAQIRAVRQDPGVQEVLARIADRNGRVHRLPFSTDTLTPATGLVRQYSGLSRGQRYGVLRVARLAAGADSVI